MDQTPILTYALNSLGLGAYVPVALAVIGLASVVTTVYPPTWPGAGIFHTLALLKGNATPLVPAGGLATVLSKYETPTSTTNSTNYTQK